MTRQIYVAGVDRAFEVLFPTDLGVVESADGTVETGQLIIDDPDGTYDGEPLNAAYVVETDAAPTRLWTGYILNQVESRGPYRSGPGRILTCDTMDINRNLVIRPVLSKTGYRPAETDLDRVAWLLGVDACAGLVYSGAYTNLTDNPINVSAADYRAMRPAEILADFTPVAGKRFFAFYNPSTDKPELFYDKADAAIFDASASITNRQNLLTTGIYAPDPGAEWNRSGETLYSDAEVVYKGTGRVVAHNATTKATYGEMWDVYMTDRIGEQATAQAAADQIVADHNKPDETLSFTVQLPPSAVNDLMAGERFQAQFSHFTGMQSAWMYLRITKREIHMHETGDYLVSIVATNKVLKSPGGSGRPGAIYPPTNTTQLPDIVMDVCNTVIEDSGRDGDTTSSITAVAGDDWYFEIQQTSHTAGAAMRDLWLSSVAVFSNPIYTFMAGGVSSLWTPTEIGTGSGSPPLPKVSGTFTVPTNSGTPTPLILHLYSDYLGPGVTVDECFHLEMWRGTTAPDAQPPATGTIVPWTVVSVTPGSTTSTGTTAYPYQPESLQVKVDGVLISPASYTETDPATGAFTLSWVIDASETVTVSYVA